MSPEELLMGTEWAARRFYALGSIAGRMWKSRTGLWWNVVRNLGYHCALRKFDALGYPPDQLPAFPSTHTIIPALEVEQ